jgi:hypothetical protein
MVGVRPPSTTNSAPVTANALGDATKQMQFAISSGVMKRPSGVLAAVVAAISLGSSPFNAAIRFAILSVPRHMGVAVSPSETVTTRTPWPAYSVAIALPTFSRAALGAL